MELHECKTLKQIARWIETSPKCIRHGIHAKVERGYASTDRKIPGTRLRHPGKGRTGSRIRVFRGGAMIHDHNNAKTYRCTEEVVTWLADYMARLR